MTRSIILAALVAAVATPMPVLAFAKDDKKDDQVVCRRDRTTETGSHLRAPRTCRTRAEWREIEDHTQRELQQIRDGQAPTLPPEGIGASGPN